MNTPLFDMSMVSGKRIILCDNHRNTPFFTPKADIKTDSLGHSGNLFFDIDEGRIRLNDENGVWGLFDGVETRNGITFAVGYPWREEGDGFYRTTLHQWTPMSGFGVCVSSHASYFDSTFPVISKSIVAAGIDPARVVFSVGGCNSEDKTVVDGFRVEKNPLALNMFGGLAVIDDSFPYWLSLFDTTKLDPDFLDRVGILLDVGLRPDVIRLGLGWMGFYRTDFGKSIYHEACNAKDLDGFMTLVSSVVINPSEPTVTLQPKDVYGYGVLRIPERSYGITRFARARGEPPKP